MEKEIKEFKLLCKNILNDEISREMLKAFAYSYMEILKNRNNG
jgi:hypothetical protein|tara:strand:+ start:575 stop:703 length:129 start_codon:yes stop_codon:yes gene_type:complete